MAGEAVIFDIGMDTSSFDGAMAGLKAETAKASSSLDSSFSRSFDRLASAAGSAGTAISIGVTAPLVAVGALAGRTAVNFTKLYETTMIVFESMLGGKEAAGALYSSLLDIAKGSTYAQETFLECGKKLVGMGIDAETTKAILQATTDAVAGFGGSAENIKNVTDAFAKMSNSGRVSMEEINSLSDNGVQALKILANQYGVSTDEMRSMISEGAVPAADAIAKLTSGIEDGTEGVNGATNAMAGMAASLKAGTLTGAFDSINTAVRSFSLALVGINPTLKETDEGYEESEKRIRQLTAAVTEISEIIPLLAKVFSGVTDAIGRVLDALVGSNARLDESTHKWENVTGALGEFKRYLRDTPTERLAMIGNLLVAIAVTGPALKAVSVAMGLLSGATSAASAAAGIGAGVHAAYTAALTTEAVASRAAAAALAPLNAALAANPVGVAIAAFVGLTAALGAATFAIDGFVGGEDRLTEASQEQKDEVNRLTGEYYRLVYTQGESSDAALAAKAALDDETASFEASRQTVREFMAQCDDTLASHEQLIGSLGKAEAEASSQAGAVLNLSAKVAELAGAESRDAAQKAELSAAAARLNEALGTEAVAYDEATDSVNLTADAISALGKAEADRLRGAQAMEAYLDLMQDGAAISDDLATAQAELDAEVERSVSSYGKLGPLQVYTSQNQMDLERKVRNLTDAQAENSREMEEARAKVERNAARHDALAKAVREVEAGTLSAAEAAEKYGEAAGVEIQATEVQEEADWRAAKAKEELAEKVGEAAEALREYVAENPVFAGALADSGFSADTLAQKLVDCGLSADDLTSAIDGYAEGAANAFEKIEYASDVSLGSMLETLRHNADATKNWADNITALYSRAGSDSEAQFVRYIASMGVEYAPIVQALLDDTSGKLPELAEAWASGSAAAKDAALAELGIAADGAGAAAAAAVDGANAAFAAGAAPAGESGSGTGESYADGVADGAGGAVAEADAASKQTADHLSSASGDAQQAGRSMAGEHYAQGIGSGQDSAVSAARTVSKQVADHFSSSNGDAWWAGYNMAAGMAQGIAAGQSLAVSAAARMAADSVAAARSALNEASPSKVMREVGRYYTEGYALGIADEAGGSAAAAADMARRSVEAAREATVAAARGMGAQLGILRANVASASAGLGVPLGSVQAARIESTRAMAAPVAPVAAQASGAAGSREVAREVREVRAEIEALRSSLGRTIAENVPAEVDAYVANARELAREMAR